MSDRLKQLEKELQSQSVRDMQSELDRLIQQSIVIRDLTLFQHQYSELSIDELKQIGDLFREKVKTGVALLISTTDDKLILVVCATDEAIKKYSFNAGQIVKQLGIILGGGGGGRPYMATAGGKNLDKIPEAIGAFEYMIKERLDV